MRVLMLNYEFPPLGGGAGNACFYLLKEFASRAEVKVDLVTSSVGGFRVERFAPNITVHYLDIGKRTDIHYQSNRELLTYAWKSYRYSKGLMRKKSFDVCHAFFGIPCGFVAMRLKLPYIVSLRGSDVPGYNPRFRLLDRLVFARLSRRVWRKARAVVANSAGLRSLALTTSPSQEILVIPNGVDTTEFHPAPRRAHGHLRVLSVGRLIERKGFEHLIDAMSGLDATLAIAGDGPLREALSTRAKEKKVKLSLLGAVAHERMPAIYREHDLFVLPSLNEGMSNAVLEAMASGLPIVSTDVGGTKELVRGNGRIVLPGSVESLAEPINAYARRPALLATQAKRSRALAEQMSWVAAADAYFSILEIRKPVLAVAR